MTASAQPTLPYRLGLPAWAFPGWRDRYFASRMSPLASYALVFNAVEGNTTFYGTPDAKTICAWRTALEGSDFELCFKLPRTITHEREPALDELARFLAAIAPLEKHAGPLLVQFPARVGPGELTAVERVLRQLPRERRSVLEVRHPRFFTEPTLLEPLLERYRCGRVMLDTRALHRGDRAHPEVLAALHEKPDLPVLPTVYNALAFVRLVLHPDQLRNRVYIGEWAAHVAEHIACGITSYMMIHCPNNLHCPELAAEFHRALTRQRGMEGLEPLPSWPVPQQGRLV